MALVILWLVLVSSAVCVDAQENICYGPGSIALSVILSILLTGAVVVGLYYLWRKYRKPKELILETDPEKGQYAFDNPGFKDAGFTPINKTLDSGKHKWAQWSPLTALTTKCDKKKTLDDTAIDGNSVKVVALRSHDFTGLGFNICGNMKEGIYIKDVLHRGPASESGKLNAGDRINSVTISFEHMVYEDALTILSYASPYEVIIEAKGGKILHQTNPQTSHLTHPIYRSSSCIELVNGNSTKRRLFPQDDHNSPNSTYSSLQKSRSNMTTLERKNSQSPQNLTKTKKKPISPEQLKNQLEQKIESQTQRTEANLEKFGVRVLPCEKSPKSSELSQNDNNINLEKQPLDEKPQVKKREKKLTPEETFDRSNVLNNSGVKRDCNGIPQEIPNYMMNAAVAARTNRKGSDDIETTPAKKSKGKAPAPPEESKKNLDEIQAVDELDAELPKTNIENLEEEIQVELRAKNLKDYNSDSDLETDNQSSVNTIELNSSDITIHHSEENEERQNRRTASTGDLTKIQRTRKSSSGTLERAQSLDITDTSIPSLTKKRRHEDDMRSQEDIFGKVMMAKEPRLSLILDGLNTFQRNRLKKSTEWGNLEDAILKLNQEDESSNSNPNVSLEKFDLSEKSEEIDALVNKINEIKRESLTLEIEEPPKKVKNEIWPNFELEKTTDECAIQNDPDENPRLVSVVKRQREPPEIKKPAIPIKKEHLLTKKTINENKTQPNLIDLTRNFIFSEKIANSHEDDEDTNVSDDIKVSRHSLVGSLERPKSDDAKMNVSNISVNLQNEISDLYTTALDTTLKTDQTENSKITISTPDIIKNVTLTEAINKLNTEPSSLTLEILDEPENKTESEDTKNHSSLTYITEIQVLTPTNISEIEIIPNGRNLDHEFENFVRNFETTIEASTEKPISIIENDPEKELHKIQSIAEEQLKKLPEMRFTTSSYESPKTPEKRSSIELLRSNFEKSPKKTESVSKSRIPIATATKTPPTSPERRDSRNLEVENDKEILELMQASVHSTPMLTKYQMKPNKNVTVTSIRNNSKIPSGLPVLSTSGNRPAVPPRKHDDEHVVQVSTNGGTESSFKQWVFSPENSVTNIVLSENKK